MQGLADHLAWYIYCTPTSDATASVRYGVPISNGVGVLHTWLAKDCSFASKLVRTFLDDGLELLRSEGTAAHSSHHAGITRLAGSVPVLYLRISIFL